MTPYADPERPAPDRPRRRRPTWKDLTPEQMIRWAAGSVVMTMILFVLLSWGIRTFDRYQARADAHNKVQITAIEIQNAQQQAKVVDAQTQAVIAKANQRYQEAIGIRRAQDEISKTLSPLYVQHEAVQALEQIAASGRNNTVVYVPSGQSGVPVITAQAGTGK